MIVLLDFIGYSHHYVSHYSKNKRVNKNYNQLAKIAYSTYDVTSSVHSVGVCACVYEVTMSHVSVKPLSMTSP